jgi:hypothetical protein
MARMLPQQTLSFLLSTMTRTASRATLLGALLMLCTSGGVSLRAQSPADLAGSWTLNRQLSEFPQEVGFSASFLPSGSDGGGRGRGGQTQTAEDSARVRFLTDEVRLPPERLTIVVTPATVTLTPDRGAARTVQPGRRDQPLTFGPITAIANTTWEAGRLVIVYKAETGRLLRYTYSAGQKAAQLIVEVEFVERGTGDKVRRVYEPTPADAPVSEAPPPARPLRGLGAPGGGFPFSPPTASAAVDQRPDAALKGLARLGVVVEGLAGEAAKCGLKQEALESAVTKRLTDAGLRVVRDSEDDTYLYVNVGTVTWQTGLCVSRYDVTLYSHSAGQLPHTASQVPLQVELLHRGGLAGGSPATHADGVLKSVIEEVDQFATRIKRATQP